MNNRILLLLGLLTLLVSPSCDQAEDLGGCPDPNKLDGYELVWADEFDGTAINADNWSYDIGDGCDRGEGLCGWGNNELQYYTDSPENAYIEDGKLVVKAKKETPLFQGQYEYTSARMVTKGKADFKYGRIDARAKMPIGRGLWPAIWMLPTDTIYGIWPRSGEIDIMEYLGNDPNKVFGTIHFGHDFWRFIGEEYRLPNGAGFHEDFHVFSVVWTEDCITFLMDDIPYSGPYTRSDLLPTTWPFDNEFHLIVNIAVGGNLPGNPDASTQFPQTMEVDYIRVYQQQSD